MSSKYTKKTSRSRRKLHRLKDDAVTVDVGEGRATVQMVLPMEELLSEVAQAVEHMAGEVGLGLIKGLIDEEVRQLAGERYAHDKGCQVHRWDSEEGHVIFAGRKVAMERPRVRGKDGKEVPLQRYVEPCWMICWNGVCRLNSGYCLSWMARRPLVKRFDSVLASRQ